MVGRLDSWVMYRLVVGIVCCCETPDGDSWSTRLSSTSKRYQLALQSRSSELDFELLKK